MKIFTGTVVSTKMKDTAIVEILRRTPHPVYKKLLRKTKRYKVDTKGSSVQVGDTVKIVETRPMAKDKYFMIYKGEQKEKEKPVVAKSTLEVPVKRTRKKKEENPVSVKTMEGKK